MFRDREPGRTANVVACDAARAEGRQQSCDCIEVKAVAALLILGFALGAVGREPRWWKGNLHTHTFWSDGDDFPDMVTAWYKDQGYNFLAISDHNVMLEGEKWIPITNAVRTAALDAYIGRFGPEWVEQRAVEGKPTVRLKTFIELNTLFSQSNSFLMIPSEEITAMLTIHLNGTNLREFI